jgi:hypothetical protein
MQSVIFVLQGTPGANGHPGYPGLPGRDGNVKTYSLSDMHVMTIIFSLAREKR